jgi:hypothetical protein
VCVCVIVCLLDLLMTQFVTVSVSSVVYYDMLCNNRFVPRVNERDQQEIQIARRVFRKGLGFILEPAVSCTLAQILTNVGESPMLSCGRWILKLCCVLGCGWGGAVNIVLCSIMPCFVTQTTDDG